MNVTILRKTVSILIALALVLTLPVQALAATYYLEDGSITVTHDGTTQSVTQNSSTTPDSAPVITQKDSSKETANTITVESTAGKAASLTIKDVNIQAPGTAIEVGDSSAEITVEGTNTITGTETNGQYNSDATIHVSSGDLTLTGGKDDSLTVTAGGELSKAAAIGSNSMEDLSGSITIAGEIALTAQTTGSGSAIGSGFQGDMRDGATIDIQGGTVTAESAYGTSIGAYGNMENATIRISGGDVTATVPDESSGSAIGAGGYMNSGALIEISGGNVTATGSDYSAAIGSMENMAQGSAIHITGGNVIAQAGDNNSAIGGGEINGAEIRITGGTVAAVGGSDAPGIGTEASRGIFDSTILIGGDATVIVQSGAARDGDPHALGVGSNCYIEDNCTLQIRDNANVIVCQDGTIPGEFQVTGDASVTTTAQSWQEALAGLEVKPEPSPVPVPEKTAVTLSDDFWKNLLKEIEAAEAGTEITAALGSRRWIPVLILEAIQSNAVTLLVLCDDGTEVRLTPDITWNTNVWSIKLDELLA